MLLLGYSYYGSDSLYVYFCTPREQVIGGGGSGSLREFRGPVAKEKDEAPCERASRKFPESGN